MERTDELTDGELLQLWAMLPKQERAWLLLFVS
jgi:hypothetical protein